jgi:transcriptional regulator with XRE-family HTH domain
MSIDLGKKIELMRESERMNRKVFSEAVGVPYSTIGNYENKGKEPSAGVLIKILSHPTFAKYRDWLMFDTIDPGAGQIAPALAHFGQGETACSASGKKTG